MIEYLSRQDLLIRCLESFKATVVGEELQIAVKEEQYYQEIEQKYALKLQQTYERFGFPIKKVRPIYCEEALSDAEILTKRETELSPIVEVPSRLNLNQNQLNRLIEKKKGLMEEVEGVIHVRNQKSQKHPLVARLMEPQ